MRGVVVDGSRLVWVDRPDATPGPGEVRIGVVAAGLNRADLAQRAGVYPPPPGASDVLGLECAGVVDAVGPGAAFAPGDRVAALLAGGGCATSVIVDGGSVFAIPDAMGFDEAAALPEALCTVYTCLSEDAPPPGSPVVWHAGASGIGTTGVQIARALGHPVFVTVGAASKLARCRALGAADGWVRTPGGFVDAVRAFAPDGVGLVVDPVGGDYVPWDLSVLARGGRLVILAFLAGRDANVDLAKVLTRHLRIRGTTLRSRSIADKAAIVADVVARYWPHVASGAVGPVIDRVYPAAELDAAHTSLASNEVVGKLVIRFDPR